MDLFTFFRSSTSYRLRIALAFKSLDYTPHYVSLPKMEHRQDSYLALNPQGLVPALVDDGAVYTQSLAIMDYLDETHPSPPFLPQAAADRAYVRALSQIIGCDIHPLNNVRVLKYLQGRWEFTDAERDEWYQHWIAEGLRNFEAMLNSSGNAGRYCCGDTVTSADICLVPQLFNAQRFNCDLSPYPRSNAIMAACMELPCFEQTQPKYQPDAF